MNGYIMYFFIDVPNFTCDTANSDTNRQVSSMFDYVSTMAFSSLSTYFKSLITKLHNHQIGNIKSFT